MRPNRFVRVVVCAFMRKAPRRPGRRGTRLEICSLRIVLKKHLPPRWMPTRLGETHNPSLLGRRTLPPRSANPPSSVGEPSLLGRRTLPPRSANPPSSVGEPSLLGRRTLPPRSANPPSSVGEPSLLGRRTLPPRSANPPSSVGEPSLLGRRTLPPRSANPPSSVGEPSLLGRRTRPCLPPRSGSTPHSPSRVFGTMERARKAVRRPSVLQVVEAVRIAGVGGTLRRGAEQEKCKK